MSLLLNGAKTVTIAGTEMQCIEVYTGESYTLPFQFTYANAAPINCTGWTLGATAKWYTCNVTYDDGSVGVTSDTMNITNLQLLSPQPGAGASANLTAAFTTIATGVGYIYVPSDISGGVGSPPSPTPTLTETTTNLVIVTMSVTRTDALSGKVDISREPLGMLVRYQ